MKTGVFIMTVLFLCAVYSGQKPENSTILLWKVTTVTASLFLSFLRVLHLCENFFISDNIYYNREKLCL